jgi:hypothetical protein
MTLIFYGHVPEWMFAISDRRLSNPSTGEVVPSPATKLTYFTTARSIPSHCMSFILIPDVPTKPEWPRLPSVVDLKGHVAGWTWADFEW